MALMHESDPRFAHLERRVGFFLAASVLIVLGVVGVVGVRQDLFTAKSTLVFHDDTARDLTEGMEVVTRGLRIGKVRRVRLDDAGRVEVTLAIRTSNLRWIRRDSTARVVAKALIGDSRIEISPGTPQAPPMPAGGVIAFEREPDLTDIAKKVMEDVKPVLLAVKSLVEYLDDPQGDVKQAIAGVNKLAAGLNETRGRVDDLVGQGQNLLGDADRTTQSLHAFVREDLRKLTAALQDELLPQLRGLVADADRATNAAGGSLDRVNRELPAILERVNASLENLKTVTGELVPAAKEASGVLREGGALVEDAQALVQRTGELWPFRTGKKEPGTTVDVDSYSTGKRPDPGRAAGPGAR